jgi:cardiolipin synthase
MPSIARQNQHLFASDWMTAVDEDLGDLLLRPVPLGPAGFPAKVIGTGPTVRYSAMPELFESLMHAARRASGGGRLVYPEAPGQ